LPEAGKIQLPTRPGETVFVFLMQGDAKIGGRRSPRNPPFCFGEGDYIEGIGSA
jgi:hypothetical protein